jgi:chromosome segregation ATPase
VTELREQKIEFTELSCPNHFGIETQCCRELSQKDQRVKLLESEIEAYSRRISDAYLLQDLAQKESRESLIEIAKLKSENQSYREALEEIRDLLSSALHRQVDVVGA